MSARTSVCLYNCSALANWVNCDHNSPYAIIIVVIVEERHRADHWAGRLWTFQHFLLIDFHRPRAQGERWNKATLILPSIVIDVQTWLQYVRSQDIERGLRGQEIVSIKNHEMPHIDGKCIPKIAHANFGHFHLVNDARFTRDWIKRKFVRQNEWTWYTGGIQV